MDGHPLALAALEITGTGTAATMRDRNLPEPSSLLFEREMAKAALLVHAGDVPAAVELLLAALRSAPPGNAGWWISLDPSLRMWEQPDVWEPVLDAVNMRAL